MRPIKVSTILKRLAAFVFVVSALVLGYLVMTGLLQNPVPDKPLPQMKAQNLPEIKTDRRTGEKTTRIRVLTYNVAALPAPARFGRKHALAQMAHFLESIQGTDIAPHIVLLQEAFDPTAVQELVHHSGYVNYIHGPERTDKAPRLDPAYTKDFKRKEYIFTGEGWGKLNHSGLAILSNLPLVVKHSRPFRYCAGWDCLANKGVLAAEVEIPGVPGRLMVANTHLNARKAAQVPFARSLFAHHLQVYELKYFAKKVWDRQMPLIFGGDFNIKNKEDRIQNALEVVGYDAPQILPRFYCLKHPKQCTIQLDMKGDEPWKHTQDIQGFANGNKVTVEPVRIMAMFDGAVFGEQLSDHDGYLVEYLLRWK